MKPLLRTVCVVALLLTLVAGPLGCARTPDEGEYTALAGESFRTTLLVASEVFTTYDRLAEGSPYPPEPMPLELLDGMDKRIEGWRKAIEREYDRLSSVEPPAGYTIVHEDLLEIDAAMIASLELLADIERRRVVDWDLGDLRREVNAAFYDTSDMASQLNDVLPKVGTTAATLGVYPDGGGDQMQEIIEYGEW